MDVKNICKIKANDIIRKRRNASIEKALAFYQRVNAYQDIKVCEGYIMTIRNAQTQLNPHL